MPEDPLHYACRQKNPNYELLELLINNHADINMICRNETPVYLLANNTLASVDMIKLFDNADLSIPIHSKPLLNALGVSGIKNWPI